MIAGQLSHIEAGTVRHNAERFHAAKPVKAVPGADNARAQGHALLVVPSRRQQHPLRQTQRRGAVAAEHTDNATRRHKLRQEPCLDPGCAQMLRDPFLPPDVKKHGR